MEEKTVVCGGSGKRGSFFSTMVGLICRISLTADCFLIKPVRYSVFIIIIIKFSVSDIHSVTAPDYQSSSKAIVQLLHFYM